MQGAMCSSTLSIGPKGASQALKVPHSTRFGAVAVKGRLGNLRILVWLSPALRKQFAIRLKRREIEDSQLIDLTDVLYAEINPPAEARIVIEHQLRRAIESGQLPPGTRIKQQVVADIFSVSRMPVREALRALDVRGYLINDYHKGYVVAEVSRQWSSTDLPEALAPVKVLYKRLTNDDQRADFVREVMRILQAPD